MASAQSPGEPPPLPEWASPAGPVLTVLLLLSRMMWAAGTIAAMSSITFPAVSALVSHCASADQQGGFQGLVPLVPAGLAHCVCVCVCDLAGVAQGMITGIRGLCNGLGPALYGFIFYLFNVELSDLQPAAPAQTGQVGRAQTHTHTHAQSSRLLCSGRGCWFQAPPSSWERAR